MPIYEYRCEACGHALEALQKMSEAPLTDCPECGAPALKKQVSAAGFQLKGSGWYATDFKGGGRPAAPAEGPTCGAGACPSCVTDCVLSADVTHTSLSHDRAAGVAAARRHDFRGDVPGQHHGPDPVTAAARAAAGQSARISYSGSRRIADGGRDPADRHRHGPFLRPGDPGGLGGDPQPHPAGALDLHQRETALGDPAQHGRAIVPKSTVDRVSTPWLLDARPPDRHRSR